MISRLFPWRRQNVEDPLHLLRSQPITELSARFAEQRRIEIDDVPFGTEKALTRAATKRRVTRRTPGLPALLADEPSYMFYEDEVHPHRDCRRACAPICAFGCSAMEGELLNFVRAMAKRPRLVTTSIHLRAYVKGSHVDRGVPTRRGIEVMWCATRGWDPAWGADLGFEDEAVITPRFGALHIVDRHAADAFAIALVKEHGPLLMLSAWMEDDESTPGQR